MKTGLRLALGLMIMGMASCGYTDAQKAEIEHEAAATQDSSFDAMMDDLDTPDSLENGIKATNVPFDTAKAL